MRTHSCCRRRRQCGNIEVKTVTVETMNLWNSIPCEHSGDIHIKSYIPDVKKSDGAVIVFAGGAYMMRTPHSGERYAEFLADVGITAFVVDYRIKPYGFPLPLLDARRAVKFVRYHSAKYGIDKSKISVMGTSAGGHLAALVSTYFEEIDYPNKDEIDKENFIPNLQILCYPVIYLYGDLGHTDSAINILGKNSQKSAKQLTPADIVSEKTPPAFVWHCLTDSEVHVFNSINYVKALKEHGVPTEFHIFPDGWHGIGLAEGNADDRVTSHVHQWTGLLLEWLKYNNF